MRTEHESTFMIGVLRTFMKVNVITPGLPHVRF